MRPPRSGAGWRPSLVVGRPAAPNLRQPHRCHDSLEVPLDFVSSPSLYERDWPREQAWLRHSKARRANAPYVFQPRHPSWKAQCRTFLTTRRTHRRRSVVKAMIWRTRWNNHGRGQPGWIGAFWVSIRRVHWGASGQSRFRICGTRGFHAGEYEHTPRDACCK